MQKSSSSATVNYAIISADYVFLSENEAKRHRLELVEQLNESLDKLRNLNEQYFEPQNVLILWKNNPDENYLRKNLGHSNDLLITEFCDRIAQASKREPVELIIDQPETLYEKNESMFIVLERLINIWKQTNIIPILLENDFLSLDDKWKYGNEGWRDEWYNATSGIDRMKAVHLAKETTLKEKTAYFESVKGYYEHFYSSIEKLIGILKPLELELKSNKREDEKETPKTDFIHTYFLWQAGIYSSIEKAQEAMNQEIATSTWYRYCDNFESNLVYEEYTVAFWRYLCLAGDAEMQEQNPGYKKDGYVYRPKKGKTPDAIKFLCFINKEERRSFFEPGYIPLDPYLEFKEIKSLIDVKRVQYTANIQFKHLRCRKSGANATPDEHYGYKIITQKVAKYKYELADLYPINSKRSPYYEQFTNFSNPTFFSEDELAFFEAEETEEEKEWLRFLAEHEKTKEQE